MKQQYKTFKFRKATLEQIQKVNEILMDYRRQGYQLTLRQLYYQLVSKNIIPNKQTEYAKLSSMLNDARLAGLVDWDSIVDLTRGIKSNNKWDTPEDIIGASAAQFRIDRWEGQEFRPEVWVEKDALVGVIGRICRRLDVPYFSCRGFTSQTAMRDGAMRLYGHQRQGQTPVILHLGDHDPSGMHMTEDIVDRMIMFTGRGIEVRRLALNMEQIEEYSPPPNPAKEADPRFVTYQAEYGDESWELDSLEPSIIAGIIRDQVKDLMDRDLFDKQVKREAEMRKLLGLVDDNWDIVAGFVKRIAKGDYEDEVQLYREEDVELDFDFVKEPGNREITASIDDD